MGLILKKLESILEISIEQFKKHKKLLKDLNETKCKLADRKDIEKAKVMLMQMHQIEEEQAFSLLRKKCHESPYHHGGNGKKVNRCSSLATS